MKFETDDIGNQHDQRLAEQSRFGLDPAHAPADHSEPVDHRRVRIHADERVREGECSAVLLGAENHLAQVFEIHLMADASVGRDDSKIAEGFLSPAQKGVALDIALIFDLGVEMEGLRRSEAVDLN